MTTSQTAFSQPFQPSGIRSFVITAFTLAVILTATLSTDLLRSCPCDNDKRTCRDCANFEGSAWITVYRFCCVLLFAGSFACLEPNIDQPGDQGFGITISVTALSSGLIFLGKAVNGDFEGPGEGLFYVMEAIGGGGSMFVAMLFGLWLRGRGGRLKLGLLGKRWRNALWGWLGVGKLNSGTAFAMDQVTETCCVCALLRLQHQYTRGSRKAL